MGRYGLLLWKLLTRNHQGWETFQTSAVTEQEVDEQGVCQWTSGLFFLKGSLEDSKTLLTNIP